jgi:hypothetical protein
VKKIIPFLNRALSIVIGFETSLNDAARLIMGMLLLVICFAAYAAVGLPVLIGGAVLIGYATYSFAGAMGATVMDCQFFALLVGLIGFALMGCLLAGLQYRVLSNKSVRAFGDRIAATKFSRWLDGDQTPSSLSLTT